MWVCVIFHLFYGPAGVKVQHTSSRAQTLHADTRSTVTLKTNSTVLFRSLVVTVVLALAVLERLSRCSLSLHKQTCRLHITSTQSPAPFTPVNHSDQGKEQTLASWSPTTPNLSGNEASKQCCQVLCVPVELGFFYTVAEGCWGWSETQFWSGFDSQFSHEMRLG